ncbi:MAG: transcriptional regulator PpsR, partial [Myxococcota bacterium]
AAGDPRSRRAPDRSPERFHLCREKAEALLQEVRDDTPARSREVNHSRGGLGDFPVRYSAIPLGKDGNVLVIGRELGAIADLQQQLINAQQSMEREYAKLRNAETRYRLLFQISTEPVLIVDAASLRVTEINPSAAALIGERSRAEGQPIADVFVPDDQARVLELLNTARNSRLGNGKDIEVQLSANRQSALVTATVFRQGTATHFLLRFVPENAKHEKQDAPDSARALEVIEGLPDSFVVIDEERRILTGNAAFLDLAQVATESQLRDQPLDRWLGRPGVDLNILLANLREHGSVRNFSTVVQGELGSTSQVEVSAVEAMHGGEPCYGFMIRPVQAPIAVDPNTNDLPQSVQQLTGLVGRVSLKEIVRETTDVIERLCIEAALEVSGGNRASAAQILGLSRQSLYSKLRRHAIAPTGGDS